MKTIKRIDQMGRTVLVPQQPMRIVSLVPSQTELLHHLGLANRIVGLTKFCIHPVDFKREKTIVGGTKNVNIDKVRALKPDLIIGNKEENFKSDIEALEKEFPVWMSDIYTLEDSYEFMRLLGEMLNVDASAIISDIQYKFEQLKPIVASQMEKRKVAYVIWNNPIMLAGKNTFINHLIGKLNWENVCKNERYPVQRLEDLPELDVLLLSSEPYPFKEKHIKEFQAVLPITKIILVDGEYFSWYGSRLLGAPDYFADLINSLQE